MAQSNPIYSHDLYQPGAEDQLKLLHDRLVQLQGDIKDMTISAKGLKTALGKLNVNNGGSQKQIIDLARKVEQLNRELERTKQAHQKTQQEIERTRLAEERRLAQSIKAEGALSREIDQANERRAASTRKQQASDQALDQKRIASAQRVADNQRRINAGIQSNAQKTAAAIANMNAIASARVGAINQSRGISQARANAQAAIQAQRLAVAQNQAATSSIRLSIAQNQNAASALRLAQAQRRAEEAAKRKTGTLSGLLGSIRSLTYAYFSLSAAQQIVGKLFSETKALNTLDIALKQTLGSIQAVTEAKQFLLDITERYGADLLTTSNAYLKFGTAAKQAGVSAQDTRNIFESVTKASSVLGLGAERTSYVFLALEQIMSKGRLSTEELRRQLGEHLPGAFGIAAKAMKVTTAELTDMLKKGEIASTDFLPKFAKELEKTYGIESLKRVDNLAAAQGRFNNEITLLIRELDVAGFFKDFFDALASGVRFVRDNVQAFMSLGKALLYVGAAWAAFKVGAAVQALGSLRRAVIALTVAMEANPFGALAATIVLLLPKIQQLIRHINGVSDATYAMRDSIDEMNKSFAEEYKRVTDSLKVFSDINSTIKERKEAYDQLNEVYPGILNYYDLEERKIQTLIKAQDDLRKAVIDRIANEALDESNKQLFKDLQDASTFTPGFFSLYNKNSNGLGVNQEDIDNARKKESEIAIADAKQRAEIIKQTAEQLKNLRSEELDQLTRIDQLEGRAVGRSFGQLDQQMQLNEALNREKQIREILNDFSKRELEAVIASKEGSVLRKKVAAELLAEKYPSITGGGGTGTKKDPRLVEIERLKYLNSLRREGMAKDLEALALNLAEKRILYEKDAEVLAKLEEYKWQQIQAIREKYVSIEADRQEQDTKDLIEGLNTVAESVAKAFAARASGNLGQTAEQKQAEFDLQQAHEKRLFELHEENADKREKFDIQQEIDLINFKLKLNEQYGGLLNEKEIQRLNELRDALQIELGKPIKADKKEVDIFSLLGINFDSKDQKDAAKEALDYAKGQLTDFLNFQKEIIDQQIEDADRLVRSKEETLNRQVALAAANQANNVAGAQAELALAKKTQEEALKQRQKFQKTELALNTALEASNLGVAIAKTLAAGLGVGGIALVALMLGAFAAAKIKAFQLVNKKTFRKGGFREIGGGTHESGNDTHVGGNNWAEKDESVGIFNKNATKKYKPTLKAFVNAANKGTLDKILFQDRRAIQGITNNYGPRVDTSVMEKRLGRLVSLTEKKSYVDGSGNLVINDRGRTTIVRNGSK